MCNAVQASTSPVAASAEAIVVSHLLRVQIVIESRSHPKR